MISDEFKVIIDGLTAQGGTYIKPEATEEQISVFENEHGVTLPSKYKEWLQYSDGGDLCQPGGIQLYGVAHKPLINPDNNDRPSEEYIVIGALASGDPLVCEKEGERISIYNHEAERIEEDETYADFLAFLSDLDGILGIGG